LAVGNSVYASDCVQRPLGCIVFKNAQELIDHLRAWQFNQRSQQSRLSDNGHQILELYTTLNGDLDYATDPQ
jgi:hypothetical protein